MLLATELQMLCGYRLHKSLRGNHKVVVAHPGGGGLLKYDLGRDMPLRLEK